MVVRPIDANVAMKKIREYMEDFPNAHTRLTACRAILSMLGDENQMPTLTPPNEWVSVDERLPEESDGMVLFTNGKAVTSGYRNHMFRMSGEEGIYAPAIRKGGGYMRVTHWMPLPEPPTKEDQK